MRRSAAPSIKGNSSKRIKFCSPKVISDNNSSVSKAYNVSQVPGKFAISLHQCSSTSESTHHKILKETFDVLNPMTEINMEDKTHKLSFVNKTFDNKSIHKSMLSSLTATATEKQSSSYEKENCQQKVIGTNEKYYSVVW